MPNQPPVAVPIAKQSGRENATLAVHARLHDIDADTLVFFRADGAARPALVSIRRAMSAGRRRMTRPAITHCIPSGRSFGASVSTMLFSIDNGEPAARRSV